MSGSSRAPPPFIHPVLQKSPLTAPPSLPSPVSSTCSSSAAVISSMDAAAAQREAGAPDATCRPFPASFPRWLQPLNASAAPGNDHHGSTTGTLNLNFATLQLDSEEVGLSEFQSRKFELERPRIPRPDLQVVPLAPPPASANQRPPPQPIGIPAAGRVGAFQNLCLSISPLKLNHFNYEESLNQ